MNSFRDFPFYNDKPYKLSIIKRVIWFGITIGTFFIFSGVGLTSIYTRLIGHVSKKELEFIQCIGIGVGGFVILGTFNYFVVEKLLGLKEYNDIAMQTVNFASFFEIVIQLMAEELRAIIPFLATLTLMNKLTKGKVKVSVIVAWTVSSVIFALLRRGRVTYG